MEKQQLLNQLIAASKQHISFVEDYKNKELKVLNHKENNDTWSVLECIEHLNLYGDFYNPSLTNSLSKAKTSSKKQFKSGFLGNYFTQSMYPKDKLNKMKTFKDKNPVGSALDKTHLDRFITQQEEFILLLEKAKDKDLNFRTPISISKWFKLKLGDTFHFVSAHNERHIIQANKTLQSVNAVY